MAHEERSVCLPDWCVGRWPWSGLGTSARGDGRQLGKHRRPWDAPKGLTRPHGVNAALSQVPRAASAKARRATTRADDLLGGGDCAVEQRQQRTGAQRGIDTPASSADHVNRDSGHAR